MNLPETTEKPHWEGDFLMVTSWGGLGLDRVAEWRPFPGRPGWSYLVCEYDGGMYEINFDQPDKPDATVALEAYNAFIFGE